MKVTILFISLILSIKLFSQGNRIQELYMITKATRNGRDISSEKGKNLVLYHDKYNLYQMTICTEDAKDQWHGRIFEFEQYKPIMSGNYKLEKFSFRWSTSDDYNNEKVWYDCLLSQIYRPDKKMFTIEISSNNKLFYYEGYSLLK